MTLAAKRLDRALWGAQIVLALAYGIAGFFETTQSYATLNGQMAWTRHVAPWFVHTLGAAEALGAVALIVPSASRIRPSLTVAAALCLVVVQVLAIPMHIAIDEYFSLPANAVLLALAAFVAWGRGTRAVITPRRAHL